MVNGSSPTHDEPSTTCINKSAPEDLLDAWLQATTIIRNERFVKELTYNESIICKLLADDAINDGDGLTATDLCNATQMRKSQMNRTLTSMEERGLITRSTSKDDRRKQLVRIRTEEMERFLDQHARIISFVDSVMNELGHERSLELTATLKDLVSAVRKVNDA